ncbi:MAG: hypothetical protein OK441_05700, partial [Thaumarchaeota archaeon]|nr:hypothetical protein [Nitrososphaerota archaeon]
MTYVSRRIPRAHQAEALSLIDGQKFFALLMAMRTGKTKVVVDDWGRMAEQGTCVDLLVIAPAGSYLTWVGALQADLPADLWARTNVHVWSSSSAKKDAQNLGKFMEYPPWGLRVLLVNSEAISAVRAVRDLCLRFLRQNIRANMVVVDESVIIKAGPKNSVLSKFAMTIEPLSAYRRILTGLVSPRSPLDVYWQMRFLSPKTIPESFSAFRERHAVVKHLCMLPKEVVRRKLEVQCRRVGVVRAAEATGVTALEMMTRDEMVEAIFRMGGWIQ